MTPEEQLRLDAYHQKYSGGQGAGEQTVDEMVAELAAKYGGDVEQGQGDRDALRQAGEAGAGFINKVGGSGIAKTIASLYKNTPAGMVENIVRKTPDVAAREFVDRGRTHAEVASQVLTGAASFPVGGAAGVYGTLAGQSEQLLGKLGVDKYAHAKDAGAGYAVQRGKEYMDAAVNIIDKFAVHSEDSDKIMEGVGKVLELPAKGSQWVGDKVYSGVEKGSEIAKKYGPESVAKWLEEGGEDEMAAMAGFLVATGLESTFWLGGPLVIKKGKGIYDAKTGRKIQNKELIESLEAADKSILQEGIESALETAVKTDRAARYKEGQGLVSSTTPETFRTAEGLDARADIRARGPEIPTALDPTLQRPDLSGRAQLRPEGTGVIETGVPGQPHTLADRAALRPEGTGVVDPGVPVRRPAQQPTLAERAGLRQEGTGVVEAPLPPDSTVRQPSITDRASLRPEGTGVVDPTAPVRQPPRQSTLAERAGMRQEGTGVIEARPPAEPPLRGDAVLERADARPEGTGVVDPNAPLERPVRQTTLDQRADLRPEGTGVPELPLRQHSMAERSKARNQIWDFLKSERGSLTKEPISFNEAVAMVRKRAEKVGKSASEFVDKMPNLDPKVAVMLKQEILKQDDPIKKLEGMIGEDVQWKQGWTQEKRFNWSDRYAALSDIVGTVAAEIKRDLLPSENPYQGARQYSGHAGIVQNAWGELIDVMRPVRKLKEEFRTYLLAERVKERAGRDIKNPNKVAEATAKDALTQLKNNVGRKKMEAIEGAAKKFYKWADERILEPAQKAGLIDEKVLEKARDKNKAWLPFDVIYHLSEASKHPGGAGAYFQTANQSVVKAMTGTERLIRDPYEALGRRLVQAVSTVEKNMVGRQFVDLRKMDSPTAKLNIWERRAENKPFINEKTGKKEYTTIKEDIPPDMAAFTVLENGKPKEYLIPKEIEMSLNYLNPADIGTFSKIMDETARAFRAGTTTLHLPFTINNAWRDFQMAKLMSKYGFNSADWVGGLFEALKAKMGDKSQVYRDYLENKGGFSGYVESLRTPKTAAADLFKSDFGRVATPKNVITAPWQMIALVSEMVELAPRLGIYKRTMRKSKLPLKERKLEAAMEARQSTIDFNKMGVKMALANRWIPFLNARLQGRLNLGRVMGADKLMPGIPNAGKQARPFRALWTATQLAVVPGIMTYLWNRMYYGDEYDKIDGWLKDNYFNMIYDTTTDEDGRKVPKFISIPKGDVGQVFFNPIEYALDAIFDKNDRSLMEFAVNMLSDLSPIEFARDGKPDLGKAISSMTPPLPKSLVEVSVGERGYDFYRGHEIEPLRFKKVDPEERYTNRTSELYKAMGSATDKSPMKIQHAFQGMLGGIGKTSFNPLEQIGLTKDRFVREGGYALDRKAFEIIDSGERSYNTARLKAIRAIEEGDSMKADFYISEHNKQVQGFLDKLKRTGVPEAENLSKFRKRIHFSRDDRKRLKKTARERKRNPRSPLARKLGSK